jgi:hypothetical protein
MADEEIDWIGLSGRKAKGKRPQYLETPEADRLLSMLMAVIGELSVTRERLDTVERLLEQHTSFKRDEIEDYTPDRDAGFERGLKTREYIARVMRPVQQDLESMQSAEPPVEDVSKELRDL